MRFHAWPALVTGATHQQAFVTLVAMTTGLVTSVMSAGLASGERCVQKTVHRTAHGAVIETPVVALVVLRGLQV